MSAITSKTLNPVESIVATSPIANVPRHEVLKQRFKQLSPKDREVLQLMLQGTKNRSIATKLDICVRTVENSRRRIHNTLKVFTVAELAKTVLEYEYHLHETKPLHDWVTLPYVREPAQC